MLACRLLTASALLVLSLPALAARPHDVVALQYQPSAATAARCPEADFLQEEVQIRIGYDLFQPDAPSRLTVTIDRANGAYRVTGELRSEAGEVTLASTFTEVECGAAIRSLAVAVAIRFTRLPEPCPICHLPAPESACPAPPEPTALPAQPPPALPERPRFQIGLASAFSVGSAPVVVGGASWFFGVRWSGFSAALEGRALFAPSAEVRGPRVTDGYHLLVADISVSGCFHPMWAFACVQAEWGSLSFSNATVTIDHSTLSHLGFGFRFGGERALTRAVALRAYVDALFELSPGNLKALTTGGRVVWDKPAFSGVVGFGPVMTF